MYVICTKTLSPGFKRSELIAGLPSQSSTSCSLCNDAVLRQNIAYILFLADGCFPKQHFRCVQLESGNTVQVPSDAQEPLWLGRVCRHHGAGSGWAQSGITGIHPDPARATQGAPGLQYPPGMSGNTGASISLYVSFTLPCVYPHQQRKNSLIL